MAQLAPEVEVAGHGLDDDQAGGEGQIGLGDKLELESVTFGVMVALRFETKSPGDNSTPNVGTGITRNDWGQRSNIRSPGLPLPLIPMFRFPWPAGIRSPAGTCHGSRFSRRKAAESAGRFVAMGTAGAATPLTKARRSAPGRWRPNQTGRVPARRRPGEDFSFSLETASALVIARQS